jgi:hypothetical protein
MQKLIQQLIKSTNDFAVEAALAWFAPDAVIDDISVGEKFAGIAGVRTYLEKFFVGYHTVTKLQSIQVFDKRHATAKLDFTGDFGHETGSLQVTVNAAAQIIAMDARLD